MKINIQPINLKLDEMGIALEDRAYLMTVAAARIVGYRLPLPSATVENPYLFFTTTHKASVLELVGTLNEAIAIDFEACVDLVQRLWIFRYKVAFDASNPAVCSFLDACLKVGGSTVPPRVSEFMIRTDCADAVETVTRMISPFISNEG